MHGFLSQKTAKVQRPEIERKLFSIMGSREAVKVRILVIKNEWDTDKMENSRYTERISEKTPGTLTAWDSRELGKQRVEELGRNDKLSPL